VVHGIITAHGGSITAESRPGRGTSFEILLPEAEIEKAEESPSAAAPSPPGTECILVVDDERPVALVMQQILESLGYEVVVRDNGLAALEAFEREKDRFDLLITDMTMPGMTGEQLAARLMGERPDLPVIICTGYSASLDKQKALEAGIRAFVQKPIMKQEIAETIRKVLGKQEV
jgi:CheY-like chemotaxis protein